MERLRTNFVGGQINNDPLPASGMGSDMLISDALAALPAVTFDEEYLAITLDPDGRFGDPEVVWIVGHELLDTEAMILRGQEDTVARAHNSDTIWIHGPTVRDFDTIKAFGGGGERFVDLGTVSGTVTLDLNDGNVQKLTLGGNTTFEFPSGLGSVRAFSFTLYVVQDATGGRTITWPSSTTWSFGEIPTASTVANTVDIYTFHTIDGGTNWQSFLSGKDML